MAGVSLHNSADSPCYNRQIRLSDSTGASGNGSLGTVDHREYSIVHPDMFTQAFIIEGRFLGEASRGKGFVHATLSRPASLLYVCPRCGDVWARFPVQGPGRDSWQIMAKPCRQPDHAHGDSPGGSVWLSWDTALCEAFPDAVLRQELHRHLDWFERTHL